jgi:hypothetical protein
MCGTCMSAATTKDRHAETPASEADAFRERHAKFSYPSIPELNNPISMPLCHV